jgi:hypothetical protein
MVQDYIVGDGHRSHRGDAEKELASFRKKPNFDFESCVRQAGLAQNQNGEKLWHQNRIPLDTLRGWAEVLVRKCESMRSCQSFEALFDIVENEGRALWGIGELAVYDTALRIGAYLKLEPDEVFPRYAGRREGVGI